MHMAELMIVAMDGLSLAAAPVQQMRLSNLFQVNVSLRL
ncbi:Unknown protein sequence [Pseudomonas syringae pv. maculicola]|nr:Unknown protein sequence [Pseudomonas syringae pv. maculicola]